MGSVNLLEKNLEKILDLAGFEPKVRTKLEGYEIDVLLEYKSIQAIFECKQYQKGSLTVRNLIHEWTGKNDEIGADRVILVLVGISVSEDDYELAEKRDITIWEGEKVDELLDKAAEGEENIKEEILTEAGLQSTEEIENRVEDLKTEFNITENEAMKYLKGQLDKDILELYSSRRNDYESLIKQHPKLKNALTESDKNTYVKKGRGSSHNHNTGTNSSENNYNQMSSIMQDPRSRESVKQLIDFMVDHEIFERDMAKLFTQGQGEYNGNSYESYDVENIRKIADELGYGIKEAIEEFDKLCYPSKIDDYVKLLERRRDLSLEEVDDLCRAGYSKSQIRELEMDVDNAIFKINQIRHTSEIEDFLEIMKHKDDLSLTEIDDLYDAGYSKSKIRELEMDVDDAISKTNQITNTSEIEDFLEIMEFRSDLSLREIDQLYDAGYSKSQIKNLRMDKEEAISKINQITHTSEIGDFLEIMEFRSDLSLREIDELYGAGYSKNQIREELDKKERPKFDSRYEKFKILPAVDPVSETSTHLAICPECGRERPVNVDLHDPEDGIQCGGCKGWNKIKNIDKYKQRFEEAQAMVENGGGVWNGREYSSDTVDKAKFIADKFNLPIEESFKILEIMKRRRGGEYPEKKFLKKTSKVRPERKDLSFREIKEYFDEGYTVDDIVNGKDKEDETSDHKARNKKDEENQDESEEQEKDDAQGRDFNNLDKFIIKEEDKERPDYTHILICPDCKSEMPIDITKYKQGSRLKCDECGSGHCIENIQQYQEYEKKKITINPRPNQQTASVNCPHCGKDLIERAPRPGNREKITCEECNEYFVIESKGNKEPEDNSTDKEPEDNSTKGFFKSIIGILRG